MIKYFHFIFAFGIICLTACQSEENKEDATAGIVDLATEIKALEDSVYTENREGFRLMQEKNARLLIEKYEAFAKTAVEETEAIDALFKAISVAQYNKSYAKAAQLLKEIYTKYPKSNGAVRARFDEAYLYDDKIQNFDKAKELYEAFIKDYPDSKYTTTAEQCLSILGEDLDDILKRVQQKAGR